MTAHQGEQEGVIKYRLVFEERALSERSYQSILAELNHCRTRLKQASLIGQDDQRYNGDGFGNISLRVSARSFLITGSQTGHLDTLNLSQAALVNDFSIPLNQLHALGQSKPSSESMTHGIAYEVSPHIQAVVHVHSPEIWQSIDDLALPFTAQTIPYGTPQMAHAVKRLIDQEYSPDKDLIFGMKGHQDGIVAVGKSAHSCAASLLKLLHRLQEMGQCG